MYRTRMSWQLACLVLALLAPLGPSGCKREAGSTEEPDRQEPNGDPLPPQAVMRLGSPQSIGSRPLIFLPGGNTLVTLGGKEDLLVQFWDLQTGKLRSTFKPPPLEGPWVWSWQSLSPDGKIAAALGFDETGFPQRRSASYLWLWDVGTRQVLHKLLMPAHDNTSAAFSSDGRLVAAGDTEGRIRVWTLPDGKELADLNLQPKDGKKRHRYMVLRIVFSPDSKVMAVLAAGSLHLCDPRKGEELASWIVHSGSSSGAPLCVAFAPDGKLLATGSQDGLVRLWDVGTHQQLREMALPLKEPAGGASEFQPPYRSHVDSVAFSPDGKRLAAGSSDKLVRLWEVATGKEVATLEGHKESIVWVEFAPDGKTVASLSDDNTVLIWKVPE